MDERLEKLALEHQALKSLLQCPICLEMLMNPVNTKCGHIFCQGCIEDWVLKRGKRGRVSCPSCQVQGITKRSLGRDPVMAGIVVEVRRLLCSEKEDTDGNINFLDIRVIKEGARESAPTPMKQHDISSDNLKISDIEIRKADKEKLNLCSNDVIRNNEKNRTDLDNMADSSQNSSVPIKRKLKRKKKEPLMNSALKQAWNKDKTKQRKTYGKSSSEQVALDTSIDRDILPGEELSGDEEYWEERRKLKLPNVPSESKENQVNKWVEDNGDRKYVDVFSQPNPSQDSVSTPSANSFAPPRRELTGVSPLPFIEKPITGPLSTLDSNTLSSKSSIHVNKKIKKQNQLWDNMVGLNNPDPKISNETIESDLTVSPTISQIIPNSCQVDINDTFDKLMPSKEDKLEIPPVVKHPLSKTHQPPTLFCSQMSALDDSLPVMLSPGVGSGIIKRLEDDNFGDDAGVTEFVRQNDSEGSCINQLSKSKPSTEMSLSDLLADEPETRKKKGKRVSWEDEKKQENAPNKARRKKRNGTKQSDEVTTENLVSNMGKEKVKRSKLKSQEGKENAESLEEECRSVDLEGREIKARDLEPSDAMDTSDSNFNSGWGTQDNHCIKEIVSKVGKVVALEEEGLAKYEAEIMNMRNNTIPKRATFQLDASTCELENISIPQSTEEMVVSLGDTGSQNNKFTKPFVVSRDESMDKAKFKPPSKVDRSGGGNRVSFSLLGSVKPAVVHTERDKVVQFIQLGRLNQSYSNCMLPTLKEVLERSNIFGSELDDVTKTPQPNHSVAQWLNNLNTPESLANDSFEKLKNVGSVSGENSSKTLNLEVFRAIISEKNEKSESTQNPSINDQNVDGDVTSDFKIKGTENVITEKVLNNSIPTVGFKDPEMEIGKQFHREDLVVKDQASEIPAPTLSSLLQAHISSVCPPSKPNAKLTRRKSKLTAADPFLNPIPGPSGTQKKQTRAQTKLSDGQQKTQLSRIECKKENSTAVVHDSVTQIESSCPNSSMGDPWVINHTQDSCELPDIDKYACTENSELPFMSNLIGNVQGVFTQDKETEEEELIRIAAHEFDEENSKRKREDTIDSEENSPVQAAKRPRKIESDDEDCEIKDKRTPIKLKSPRSTIKRTPIGTRFMNTFETDIDDKQSHTSSQVIDVLDSQEEAACLRDMEIDMELPIIEKPVSQVTDSKSLLDSPSINTANLSRSSSASTTDSEPDMRTTQELKRDLALAEIRAQKLRDDMNINMEVLGSQALFHDASIIKKADDIPASTSVPETDSLDLNNAKVMIDTPNLEQSISADQSERIVGNPEALKETEPIIDSFNPEYVQPCKSNKNPEELCADKQKLPSTNDAIHEALIPDSDDDLFFQTPEELSSKKADVPKMLSPVSESHENNKNQCNKQANVSVDTSNWKFVTSNLIPSARKKVPEFIASLKCKGIVGKVDETVTHLIVSTGAELEAQRTLKYLQGVASGIMVVSHLWAEACQEDRKNIGLIENWEVTDEELGGANGPWRARKRKEEGGALLLAGYEILIDGQLDGLEKGSVEDLLSRAGARAVPDRNAFSFTSGVTRLVLVDSTAGIGAKMVGRLLRSYKLAMVDKDWLLDTIGGHCVRPILPYTLESIRKEDLIRAGYIGPLIE